MLARGIYYANTKIRKNNLQMPFRETTRNREKRLKLMKLYRQTVHKE